MASAGEKHGTRTFAVSACFDAAHKSCQGWIYVRSAFVPQVSGLIVRDTPTPLPSNCEQAGKYSSCTLSLVVFYLLDNK